MSSPSLKSPSNKVRTSNRRVFFLLSSFVAIAFGFPFYYMNKHNSNPQSSGNYHTNKALAGNAQIRGAYINSGSRDVGPDDTYYKKHQQQLLNQIRPNTAPLDQKQK